MTGDPSLFAKMERCFAQLSDDLAMARPFNRIPRLDLAKSGEPLGPMTILDETAEPSPEPTDPPRRGRKLNDANMALVEAALEAATTPQIRRRLKRGRRLAIVVAVPSAGWVKPVRCALNTLSPSEDFSRDGSQRTKHLPTEGNDEVANALSRGLRVIGVSQAPDRLLPAILLASADIFIRVAPPNTATVAKAMGACLRGRIPNDLPADLAAGLDFHDIVAAMRSGSKPADAVARMQAASRSRVTGVTEIALPTLEEAIFYGEARDWGLQLAQDVAAARRGEIEWSRVDRGACFFGVPGTGKSWLARIIARACSLPIIQTSIADLFASSAGFLDSVIKAQRDVFARAAAAAPCILFLDELDAMPNRATMSPRGKDWWVPVVTDFMLLLSATPLGVITISATNQISDIDAAILRPGRLERVIEVKPPETVEGLTGILRHHLGKELVGTDLSPLAHLGLGATAADAMGWVRSARRKARQAKRAMTGDDLLAAMSPTDDRTPEAIRRSAIHEAGHAIAAIVLGVGRVTHVTLLRTEKSGGRMTLEAAEGDTQFGRSDIEKYAIVSLAARAAEVVLLGGPSAGSSGSLHSDLAKATKLITAIHASLGLGGSLVYRISVDDAIDLLERDPVLRDLVDQDLHRLHAQAEELIRKFRRSVEAVADALAERRYLSGGEIEQICIEASSPKSVPDDTPDLEIVEELIAERIERSAE
jgi:cell division protease FtsH